MKISVDAARCAGHALCWGEAEDVYPLDDDGYNALRGLGPIDIEAGREEDARRGGTWCPERAIAILDETSGTAS